MTVADDAPLADIRVLDLSDGVAGQFTARLLGDWGADVVLLEAPCGTATRRLPPFDEDVSRPSGSKLFWHLNTSKSSVCLDLATPSGLALVDRLAASSDVAVTDVDGVDLDRLRRVNSRLIACRITEFSPGGDYEHWRGSEMIHQALSGLMNATGRANGVPLYGLGHRAYYAAGSAAATTVLAALAARRRLGTGQLVGVSVHEVAASMCQNLVTQFSYSGSDPQRGRYAGACDVFRSSDGWVVVFCPAGRWPAMCAELGIPALGSDDRFADHDRLLEHWPDAARLLADALAAQPSGGIVAAVMRARAMAAPVYSMSDVVTCEHLAARSYWRTSIAGENPRRVLGPVFRFSDGEPRPVRPAPAVGADTALVLSSAGVDPTAVRELRRAGVA